MAKSKKIRVDFRKNRAKPPRSNDFTRHVGQIKADDASSGERVRAKGDLSRQRTVTVDETEHADLVSGRVMRTFGLFSDVEREDGTIIRCTIRRILKTVAQDERNAVTTGDRVWIRLSQRPGVDNRLEQIKGDSPVSNTANCQLPTAAALEGVIESVEPRRGVLTRASRQREHILVSNVDQVVIVISLLEPELKVHLIDRYLASAGKGDLAPILVLNKIDLTDPALVQNLVGAYSQLGIPTVLTSAQSGDGIDRLRALLVGKTSVVSGQSGVGKSSLLNVVEPGLGLRVREVSEVTSKGMHTTTTAELIRLSFGGWVVDTPGIRQFQLFDSRPEEMEGYFREFRPFVTLCNFADCSHTHELKCGVKSAVAKRFIADRRYHSYLGLYHDVEAN